MPMPSLSPSMKSGTILQWHVKEKDFVEEYQNFMIVSTNTILTDEDAKEHKMEVEVMECMYIAKILAKEGETYAVGTPIAILVEESDNIAKAERLDVSAFLNMYSDKYVGPTLALWQAYSINKC